MTTSSATQPGLAPTAKPAAKVFVIDDDQSLLRALSRRLTLTGYDTEPFVSPSDFLKREPRNGPACIILDLMMPEMSGLEFQKALRERSWRCP
jgi:FixJ family two-component response regulator